MIEIHYTDCIHLQANQIVLRPGKNRRNLGQNQQPQPGAELQNHCHLRGNKSRCAPFDLNHRPEQIVAGGNREDLVQVAEDLRRVADGILWKHHAVQRVVLDPRAQRVFSKGAVDGQKATDAGQLETQR